MKSIRAIAVACASAAMLAGAADPAHMMFTAKDLKWNDSPSLPGAKIAVLQGPLSEAAPFTARIRLPDGYKINPHWHPAIEHVTVISGQFMMGMGEKFQDKDMHTLGPGDVMIMQPKTAHFAKAKGETVVQIHGVGPWKVNYINPADDPTKKADAGKGEKKK